MLEFLQSQILQLPLLRTEQQMFILFIKRHSECSWGLNRFILQRHPRRKSFVVNYLLKSGKNQPIRVRMTIRSLV